MIVSFVKFLFQHYMYSTTVYVLRDGQRYGELFDMIINVD